MKLHLCLPGLAALLAATPAPAINYTWDGGGTNNDVSTAANWNPDGAPVSDLANTDLFFGGTVRLTPTFLNVLSADSLTLNNTAGANAFTFSGLPLRIGTTGITNNDADMATFGNAVYVDTATSACNATTGPLSLTILGLQNNFLTFNAAVNGSVISNLTGPGTLTKTGAGTLTFIGNVTPTLAGLTLSTGTTILAAGTTHNFASSSTIAVNGGSVLNVNENTVLNGGLLTRASAAGLTLAAGKTLTVQGGGDVNLTGTFPSAATSGTITVTGAGSTFTTTSDASFGSGSSINILAGGRFSSTPGQLIVGQATSANMTVDGVGSSLVTNPLNVGFSGSGSLTFSNGSTGTFGSIGVDNTPVVGISGTLNIGSGAVVTGQGLSLAPNAVANNGTINISGAGSTLNIAGAGTSVIGAASTNTAVLNVQNSGTFNSGTGLTTVNATGTVAITGGTFNANGNVTLNGGQLTRDSSGVFNLAAGRTLTVQGGGDAFFTGNFTQANAATINVTGAGSTLQGGTLLEFRAGSAVNVTAGGSLTGSGLLHLANGGGNATVAVDGAGSTFGTGSGIHLWGQNGNTATVTFTNGSQGFAGIFGGALDLAGTGAGSVCTVNVLSGSSFNFGSLALANTAAAATATFTVNGAGSVAAAGSLITIGTHTVTIGGTGSSLGRLNVQNSGTFTSPNTGPTTVNPTGTVAITGGTFNAIGNMTVNGGQLTRDAAGTFDLAGGGWLIVQNGGDFTVIGEYSPINQFAPPTLDITGAGSTLTTTGDLVLNNSLMNILAEGSVSSGTGQVLLGRDASNHPLTVDGTGSSLSGAALAVGLFGHSASATFSNRSTGSFGAIRVGDSSYGQPGDPVIPTGGTLSILSGAVVTGSSLSVATYNRMNNGTLVISGTGSALTVNGGGETVIGTTDSSTARVDLINGGTLTTATGPATRLKATSQINMDGGILNIRGPLVRTGGVLNFNSGTLSILDNLTVGTGGLLGTDVTLDAARSFTTTATTTIEATRSLTMHGGLLSTGALVNNGTFAFNSGTLGITGAGGFTIGTGGALGANVTLGPASNLSVTNTATISPGARLTLVGGKFSAGSVSNNGTLVFNSGTLAITGAGGFNIGTGVLGAGVVLGTGSNLEVTNTTTLAPGALLQVNGGGFSGSAITNDGTIEHRGGTLAFTGTLTNNATGRLFVSGLTSPAGAIANAGTVVLQNGVGQLGGAGALTNTGLITGDGTISRSVTNSASGQIRADAGKVLAFTGTNAPSAGRVNLFGGALIFSQPFTNAAGGQINGEGALYFPSTPVPTTASPNAGLMNAGNINLTGGNSQCYGTVQMQAGSRLIASGGATGAFFDVFRHSGAEVKASAGSALVFFGQVRGAGPFTGTGTVYMEGGYSPGASPASVSLAPQMVFTESNVLTMEIGGLTAGTQHDKLTFTHATAPQVTWGGSLAVTLINGFTPAAGQSFDIFDFDAARDAGTFASLTLPALPAGLAWDTSELYTTGTLRVVTTTGLTFAAWAAANGLPGALPTADHDKDGYDNATEFALGLFPPQAGTVLPDGGFHIYNDGQRLRLLFTRPLDRTGVTLKVQASNDLTTWTDLATSLNSAPFTGAGFVSENRAHPLTEPGLVEVRDLLTPATTPRRQMRVRITLAP